MSAPTLTAAERSRLGPAEIRGLCRARLFTAPTAAVAAGYVQANLAVLPSSVADAFEAYCRANSRACPLLERLATGDPEPKQLAPGADLRTDLPRYLVHRPGGQVEERLDTGDLWTSQSVAFLLGCSFSFEEALAAAGMLPRHVRQDLNVPMYRTNRATNAVGPFAGPLVVTMRPIPRRRIDQAYAITRPLTVAHGEPVHHGSPQELGITDLRRPDWGDAVTLNDDEVPVFWACGVTSQLALTAALAAGSLDLAITHAPGHMFVTDLVLPRE